MKCSRIPVCKMIELRTLSNKRSLNVVFCESAGMALWMAEKAGASIPMGQGGHVPPIFMKGGTSMVMSPQYFRSDVV